MPFIKKGAQTEIGRKIQMLAERLPYSEWYLPDPYSPASYAIPFGGMGTKLVIKGGKTLTKEMLADAYRRVLSRRLPKGFDALKRSAEAIEKMQVVIRPPKWPID